MTMRLARKHLGALLLGALLYAHPARSQDAASTAEARVHFERAIVLFESGNASGALAEFQRAHELSGRASVLYNIGATYQALHDYPQAIEALRRFLAEGDSRPSPQRELAQRALRQMEPFVARLRLVRSPADAAVALAGRTLTGDVVTVGPGTHTLSATAPGYEPQQVQVTVVSGDEREVRLSLSPVAPVAPVAPIAPASPDPRGARAPSVEPGPPRGRAAFWSMVVTGGALAVGATITGGFAIATQRDYASRRVDDPAAPGLASRGESLSLAADLLALGALGAGAAAVVFGLQSRTRSTPPALRVMIEPGRDGLSLVGCGAF
ncbi:MAG: hypothetical protein Q7V43_28965 [Myxococcales bacterium]|nr:hypothetical protein [Myxococcales bacterium]